MSCTDWYRLQDVSYYSRFLAPHCTSLSSMILHCLFTSKNNNPLKMMSRADFNMSEIRDNLIIFWSVDILFSGKSSASRFSSPPDSKYQYYLVLVPGTTRRELRPYANSRWVETCTTVPCTYMRSPPTVLYIQVDSATLVLYCTVQYVYCTVRIITYCTV